MDNSKLHILHCCHTLVMTVPTTTIALFCLLFLLLFHSSPLYTHIRVYMLHWGGSKIRGDSCVISHGYIVMATF